jgi:hypothetical protein
VPAIVHLAARVSSFVTLSQVAVGAGKVLRFFFVDMGFRGKNTSQIGIYMLDAFMGLVDGTAEKT